MHSRITAALTAQTVSPRPSPAVLQLGALSRLPPGLPGALVSNGE
jgi:hypothetical protein